MLVRAKDTGGKYSGFYGVKRRVPGEVFEIESKAHLGRWMEPVEDEKPKRGKKKAEESSEVLEA